MDNNSKTGEIIIAEVILMAKNNPKKAAGTNVEQVKKQNQKAAQGQQDQYGTEFASETDAKEVMKQNKKSEQNKK